MNIPTDDDVACSSRQACRLWKAHRAVRKHTSELWCLAIHDTRKPSRFIPIFQIKLIIIWAKLRGRVWRLDLICFCCKIMLWEKGSVFDAHRPVVPAPSVQLVSEQLAASTNAQDAVNRPAPTRPAPIRQASPWWWLGWNVGLLLIIGRV